MDALVCLAAMHPAWRQPLLNAGHPPPSPLRISGEFDDVAVLALRWNPA
jgi:hypothetical protein